MGYVSNFAETSWELAKPQTVEFGIFKITTDFSDGLTKDEWIEREQRRSQVSYGMAIRSDGAILMPHLGIY